MDTNLTPNKKLNPILHNLSKSVTEELKRSNHADFATTSELKAKKFSGIRHNSIAMNYEFWIEGDVKCQVSEASVVMDATMLERTYKDLFGL